MNEIEDVVLMIGEDDNAGQDREQLAYLLRQGYSIIATRAVGDDTDGIWFVLFKPRMAASILVDEEIYQDLDDPTVDDTIAAAEAVPSLFSRKPGDLPF